MRVNDNPPRVIAVSSHPVQYAAPLYSALTDRDDVDFEVLFRSLEGAEEYLDEGYGQRVQWDIPLLDGFCWRSCDTPRAGWRRQPAAFARVLRELLRSDFDAVLVDGYRSAEALAGIVAAELRRKDWFLGSDATRPGGGDRPACARWLAQSAFALAVRRASGVACMATASERFAQSLGARDTVGRIATVNPALFTPPDQFSGSPSGQLRVLSVGRMLGWKRLDALIAAVRETDNVHLRLIGSGPEMSHLQSLAQGCSRIEFAGMRMQRQLAAEYYQADVLAIASHFEPFGIVAIEAAACGTPLAADESAGAAVDLVDGASAGWTVRSPSQWPELLRHLRDNAAERNVARQRAIAASTDYLPSAVAERLTSLVHRGRRWATASRSR